MRADLPEKELLIDILKLLFVHTTEEEVAKWINDVEIIAVHKLQVVVSNVVATHVPKGRKDENRMTIRKMANVVKDLIEKKIEGTAS